jgi:formylglycine-generating enzyme required for sulfatase activity
MMGLSDAEEMAAREIHEPLPFDPKYLRPCHEEIITPLFVSQKPILTSQFENWMNVSISSNGIFRPGDPARVEFDAASELASKFGARLPFEREWEYMCRGTTTTLFYWGNELPAEEELECYVSDQFEKDTDFRANPFGLYGMFTRHWCEDIFRERYDDNARIHADAHVLRGGGSDMWPWQPNCHEWVFCMSAGRTIGAWRLAFMDKTCGFRLVWDIDEWWK